MVVPFLGPLVRKCAQSEGDMALETSVGQGGGQLMAGRRVGTLWRVRFWQRQGVWSWGPWSRDDPGPDEGRLQNLVAPQ